ncbi:hypothetical protein SKAU_G00224240 [Synaphobranchus kaupii]|uniref:Meiotic recombination protein REC8 homolog n=1 Tax=Synaphobranchus kaupii TaxID=118154 RepID=A0A9Q1IVA5_SYNKA|nr:hypothetical protein SKAU_G00224240 [Synaphobranchus kaupii]
MDYVLVRAPPLQPGLPRPRFSLYLSFQLQYGIIIIYHRQCAILLEEIQQTIERLLRSANKRNIDLAESDRLALTVPDSLSILEGSEMALDPFFGVMGYTLPSPSALMQFEGVDLLEVTPTHMDIIDMLMEQQDQFPEGAVPLVHKHTLCTDRLGVTALTDDDLAWVPEKEAGPLADTPVAAPPPARLETTPPSVVPLPSSPEREREREVEQQAVSRREGEPEQERERRRRKERERDTSGQEQPEPIAAPKKQRRRRQLLFIDAQTQIPPKEHQEAIQDPLTETQSLVLVEPPSKRSVSPEELLSNPCTPLHPDILHLWEKAAIVTPLPSVAARKRVAEKETESERETARVLRELLESGLPQPEASVSIELMGEVSDREVSRLVTPESRGSPIGEIILSLEGIPEEGARPAEREIQQVAATRDNLMGMLWKPLQEHRKVSFHSLLPPLADRSTVASSFSALLELASARILGVEQEESYGSIIIAQGPLYEGDWVPHTD